MVRFYSFSITFYSSYVDPRYRMLNSVDKASYFASFLRGAVPFVGTNMLFVSKYNLVFHSRDILFFSLVNFNKLSSGPNHIQYSWAIINVYLSLICPILSILVVLHIIYRYSNFRSLLPGVFTSCFVLVSMSSSKYSELCTYFELSITAPF